MNCDVLLRNATIVDGSGRERYAGSLAVSGSEIIDVGACTGITADTVINLDGKVLAPGFIDCHTHSDLAVFERSIEAKLRQGITTEIVGNCGFSVCPVPNDRDEDARQFLSPVLGTAERSCWTDTSRYYDAVDERGALINVATLIGHGTLRLAVTGFNADPPSTNQQDRIRELFEQSLEQGAWGLSTGLVYAPGCYASYEELVDLCKLGASRGVPYVSHLRSEASALVEAVEEALAFGKATGIHIHFSHHQVDGLSNKGKATHTLALIENARETGLNVTLDQYPYQAGSTQLLAMLPQWVLNKGRPAVMERLRSPENRRRIHREFDSRLEELLITDTGWENVMLNSLPVTKDLEQMTLQDVAQRWGQDRVDALLDIVLANEGEGTVVLYDQNEEDWSRIFQDPFCSIASDSILVGEKPHPRSFGTFPHVLGTLVREQSIVSLEEAVRKMTSLPAITFGLARRGELKKGNVADLVVFDENTVGYDGTFQDPSHEPAGIERIYIRGQEVLTAGNPTGVMAGRALRYGRNGQS